MPQHRLSGAFPDLAPFGCCLMQKCLFGKKMSVETVLGDNSAEMGLKSTKAWLASRQDRDKGGGS